ncbi:MAG: class I SAM-dependent methyltransferase [Planctomyces sp.]|nr:class I SAM-dependent methyltransferase [Planctomyces sp.]
MNSHRSPAEQSAGDVDYAVIGRTYRNFRVPDPRIAAQVHAALGDARIVLNIGAGAGSYEPTDREVIAVEPSAEMRARRPPELSAAIDACAEDLPFPDRFFDAAMGTLTVHQWRDLPRGLSEVRRVTRGPVVFLTCDPLLLSQYWLNEYAPEIIATEASRFPPIAALAAGLGGSTSATPVPIPLDCTDGFNDAYYGRPELLLDPDARLACSSWSFLAPAAVARFEEHLGRDLKTGAWDARYGGLRRQEFYLGALVLVVSTA